LCLFDLTEEEEEGGRRVSQLFMSSVFMIMGDGPSPFKFSVLPSQERRGKSFSDIIFSNTQDYNSTRTQECQTRLGPTRAEEKVALTWPLLAHITLVSLARHGGGWSVASCNCNCS